MSKNLTYYKSQVISQFEISAMRSLTLEIAQDVVNKAETEGFTPPRNLLSMNYRDLPWEELKIEQLEYLAIGAKKSTSTTSLVAYAHLFLKLQPDQPRATIFASNEELLNEYQKKVQEAKINDVESPEEAVKEGW